MADYNVVRVALDTPFAKTRIGRSFVQIPDINVLYIDAAAVGDVLLYIGENADAIPLYLMGQPFHALPAETEGVWLENLGAHPGCRVEILLGYTVRSSPVGTT